LVFENISQCLLYVVLFYISFSHSHLALSLALSLTQTLTTCGGFSKAAAEAKAAAESKAKADAEAKAAAEAKAKAEKAAADKAAADAQVLIFEFASYSQCPGVHACGSLRPHTPVA
jgi:hypothetical protein